MSAIARRALVRAALLVPAAACGGVGGPPPDTSQIPDVARIVCHEGGTRVETPVIRPQRDGVHLLVHNRTQKDMGISYQQGRLGAGDNADRGTTEVVFQIAPGAAEVLCTGNEGISDESGWASLEIVDPRGLWVPPEVDCGPLGGVSVGHGDYIEGVKGDPRDPVLIAAERWGPLEPGEEVQRAGYPKGENRLVRLVRDGRVVEVVEYTRDRAGAGWLETEHTKCS